jgi:hypothetical protein
MYVRSNGNEKKAVQLHFTLPQKGYQLQSVNVHCSVTWSNHPHARQDTSKHTEISTAYLAALPPQVLTKH